MHEKPKQKLTVSIGIMQLFFLPPATLSHRQLWHCFTGWDSYGPFGFVFKKKKFPPYFILLFVWKHLKEIESLND